MPQFQVTGPDGRVYAIHSSDPGTIGRWFTETMSRFSGHFASGAYNQFQLRVWPMWSPDKAGNRGVADWCQNSTHSWCHEFQFNGTMQGLIEVLNRAIEESKVDP